MSEKKMIIYSLLFTVLIFIIGILAYYFGSIVFLVVLIYLFGLLIGYIVLSESSKFNKKSPIKQFLLAHSYLLFALLLAILMEFFPKVIMVILSFLIMFFIIFSVFKKFNEL